MLHALAAGTALLSAVAHARVAALAKARRVARPVLVLLALAATAAYTNAFRFHGAGTFIHYHDLAHYYFGAKYYDELDHGDLYDAITRAEIELPPGPVAVPLVRDLHTFDLRPASSAIVRGEHVRARFSPARWSEFLGDVRFFRERLGSHYPGFLADKGFNGTPFWALVARPLASLVPAGSHAGIAALALVDSVLLLAAFATVFSVFGVDTGLVAWTAFCVVFGADYTWIGGAFFRYGWLAATLGAVSSLGARRHRTAGALLGLATLLRIFPALFVVPIATKALSVALRRRASSKKHVELLSSFALAVVSGVALTALLPRGFYHYRDWAEHMAGLARSLGENRVGLAEIVTYRPGDLRLTWPEYTALLDARVATHRTLSLALSVPLVVAVALLSRRVTDLRALSLGIPLVFCLLGVAGYYYSFAAVLAVVLARRRAATDLSLLFGGEALSNAASLVVSDPRLVYALHGALVAAVTLLSFRKPIAVTVARARARRRGR